MRQPLNEASEVSDLLRIERILNDVISGSKNLSMAEVAVVLANVQQKIVRSVPIDRLPVYLQWNVAIEAEKSGIEKPSKANPSTQLLLT